jgi:hypothetical protein
MLVDYHGRKETLPDFLIIGAGRSGTTTLYHYVRQHPQIFVPERKEPQFFNYGRHPDNLRAEHADDGRREGVIESFQDYLDLFAPARSGQVVGEATASYLYTHELSIDGIKSTYGSRYKDLKIIAILRNPISRAYSQFLFLKKKGREPLSFQEAIHQHIIENRAKTQRSYDYLQHSMYYRRVKSFLEEFSHVKIFLFEDLRDSKKLLSELFQFLGVRTDVEISKDIQTSPSGIPRNKPLVNLLSKLNDGAKSIIPQGHRLYFVKLRDMVFKKILEKPELDEATRRQLIDRFRDDVLQLQQLINRDLSQWLEVTG